MLFETGRRWGRSGLVAPRQCDQPTGRPGRDP